MEGTASAIPDLNVRRFWSVKEAASYLECHPKTLLKRLRKRKGNIPHLRIGTKILIPIEDFLRWTEQSKIP